MTEGLWANVVGATLGNFAGQVTANATGLQDGFNWKSLVAAGVTSWIGGATGLTANAKNAALAGNLGQQMAYAAAQSVISQGVNIVAGLQEKFSWKAVAASAIATPIMNKIDKSLGTGQYTESDDMALSWGRFGTNLASEFLKSTTRQATNILVNRGGRMEWSSVAVDTFGNAIGNSIVDQMKYTNVQKQIKHQQAKFEQQRQERLAGYPNYQMRGGQLVDEQGKSMIMPDRLAGSGEIMSDVTPSSYKTTFYDKFGEEFLENMQNTNPVEHVMLREYGQKIEMGFLSDDFRYYEIAWRGFNNYAQDRIGEMLNSSSRELISDVYGPSNILGEIPIVGPIFNLYSTYQTLGNAEKVMQITNEIIYIRAYGPQVINEKLFKQLYYKGYDPSLNSIVK
jgi:hypothetical protein